MPTKTNTTEATRAANTKRARERRARQRQAYWTELFEKGQRIVRGENPTEEKTLPNRQELFLADCLDESGWVVAMPMPDRSDSTSLRLFEPTSGEEIWIAKQTSGIMTFLGSYTCIHGEFAGFLNQWHREVDILKTLVALVIGSNLSAAETRAAWAMLDNRPSLSLPQLTQALTQVLTTAIGEGRFTREQCVALADHLWWSGEITTWINSPFCLFDLEQPLAASTELRVAA